MKTFKRALSCFLALLMIFGSCSVLSYAAFGDGSRKSVIVETKFFVDGEEVTEVKAGDTVKVRIYVATDFVAATTTLFYVYPKDFMEFDNTGLTSLGANGWDAAGVFNKSETSSAVTNNLGGLFNHEVGVVIDSESDADNLIYYGYINEEYFDDKGWISFTVNKGTPVQYKIDNENDDTEDDHLAEFTFKVKEGASGEGYFHVLAESIKTPSAKNAFSAVMRASSDTAFTVASADNARRLLYDVALNDTNTITLASGEVTPTTYEVKYEYAGDIPTGYTEPEAKQLESGADVEIPAITVPAGYALTWATSGDVDGKVGTSAVTVTGTWEKIKYDVTYSFANEGPEGVSAPVAGTTTVGATIAAPSTDAPAGYTLTWTATGATKNADGSYTAGANDVAFVGTWAKVEYNVTYTYANEAPAGAAAAPSAGKTTVGATIAAPSTAALAGYTLTWAATGATKNDDGSYTAGANNVAFVGTWAKVEYDVTYTYANEAPAGAAEAPAAGKTTVGATIAAPSTAAPAGYTLTWEATGAIKNDDGSYTAGANNVAFVGTWAKIEYDVTYSFDGEYPGEAIEPAAHKTTVGATIPAPEVEVPDGWTVEWNVTGATKNADGSYTAGANDVEFVATFAKKSYTIKYYLTDADKAEGKVVFEKTYKYDEAIDKYSPVVEGKNFIAWDIDIPATMPAYDLEAVAILEDIIYTVTFTDVWGDEVTVNKDYGEALTADDIPDLTEGGTINVVMTYDGKPLAEQLPLALTEDITIDCAYNVTATFYEVYDEENPENNVVYRTYTFDVDYETTEEDFADLGAPIKKGHSLDADAPWTWDYIEQTMSENTYFVANWVANTYTATFTAGEGAFAEGVDTTVDVTFGEAFDFDAVPTREGYTCVGWTDVEGGAALDELVMDEEGKTFYPVFVENGKANYTVEIYLMDTDGKYAETTENKETGSATIGTTATVAHADYDQEAYFSADADAANKYSAVVAEDGSTVLKLYYKRAQYDVVIDGAAAVKVYHGAEVTAPTESANTPAGYELASWNDGAYAKGEVITVTAPLTLTPKFAAGTSTYTVKTYTMELDGEYGAAVETTGTYTTDETVTYTAPAVEGFKADKGSYSVKVTGDNLAVIEVYYVRNQYDVVIDGAEAVKVYYGAEVTAPATSANTPAGYTLASWNGGAIAKGDAVTVTGPLTLIPDFTANTDTKYTVEIYLMDEEGNYAETPDDTDELTGTTDTLATAAHADYAQDAWFSADDAAANVFEANITGDGNAVLKLYYKRAQYDVVIDGTTTPVYHGATITAPAATTQAVPAGYAFAGWNNGTIAAGDEITVTGPLTLEPYFAEGQATYTVEIYLQDAEGNYGAASKTETETGKTGDPVTIAHADYAQEAYYLADDAQANVYEGTIAGDGSLTLKLYFKRAMYKVAYEYEDGTAIGTATEVRYGAAITAPAYDQPDGMNFIGWFDKETKEKMPATMPAKDATYVVKFAAGDSIPYTVAVYMMDVNGEYVVTETGLSGTTGTPVSITPNNNKTGFTVNTEKSNLSDVIAGNGSTVLSVYYDRNLYTVSFDGDEYQVYYGASLPTVEPAAQEGKTFDKWVDADGKTVPASMPAENLAFTSTWKIVKYKLIYFINGEKEVYEYAVGETVTPIENPSVPGMTFSGWNGTIPDVMPAEDVIIVAKFEAAVFKVTFVDGDGNVFDEKAVKYGDAIVLPVAKPTKEYHVFKGWLDVPEKMGTENITIYPDFERVPVRLVAAEGSATVIDRSTMIITGLTTKFNDAKKDKYLAVEGDGYYTITSVEGFEGYYGTGAVVKVFDNADTSAPIEVFYIVIYGDVDGDSAVNSVDAAMVEDEALYATNWSRGENKDILKVMAADLNKDGQVRANDKDAITNTSIGITEIDQVSGTVSR